METLLRSTVFPAFSALVIDTYNAFNLPPLTVTSALSLSTIEAFPEPDAI